MSAIRIIACLALFTACAEEPESTGEQVVEEAAPSENALRVDFGLLADASWFAVNDTVMGGVSQGEVIYESDSMVFQGYVSTDSNGGFASVRSPDDVLDLSGYDDLYIRMKSEGQPFSLVLSHTDVWYEGSYRYDITGASDEWQTFVFPLENFQLYEFNGGYPTATGEWMQPADRSEIFHLELMSKLFEDGDFRLEVDYIAFD